MFGEEVLDRIHSQLKEEVIQVLTTTTILAATKLSGEKTKVGKVVWSGKDFNDPLASQFRSRGWEKKRVAFPDQKRYGFEVDFVKGGVALEIQVGKYAFVQYDFSKFRYLFEQSDPSLRIDVGIEVVPSGTLQRQMYTGPAGFESVIASLQAHARNDPGLPIWLVAIDVK